MISVCYGWGYYASPMSIPVLDVQKYLASSSYSDDILFLGFVTNDQRSWLFKNATAMVYPSVYEGFGLPVLELCSLVHGYNLRQYID